MIDPKRQEVDAARVDRTLERYKDRFIATFGGSVQTDGPVTPIDDYKMFGDMIDVSTMNALGKSVSESYIETFVRGMEALDPEAEDIDATDMLQVLMPVLRGMFEHSWTLGYMYKDEQEREAAKRTRDAVDASIDIVKYCTSCKSRHSIVTDCGN